MSERTTLVEPAASVGDIVISERSSSVLAPPRRTLRAPAAARARVQKVLSVEPAAPPKSAVQHAADKSTEKPSIAQPKPVVAQPIEPAIVARREERIARRNALALTLRKRWPDLFAPPFAIPWAVGIHAQLVEALGCSEKDLRPVLAGWSKSPGYQKVLLVEGAQRRNLDGSAAGEVTPEQQALARERLAQLKASLENNGVLPSARAA